MAKNQEAAAATVRYAVELARSLPSVQLEIKAMIADRIKAVDALTCTPCGPTYVAEIAAGRRAQNGKTSGTIFVFLAAACHAWIAANCVSGMHAVITACIARRKPGER